MLTGYRKVNYPLTTPTHIARQEGIENDGDAALKKKKERPLLYTIQCHYAHCHSAEPAAALQHVTSDPGTKQSAKGYRCCGFSSSSVSVDAEGAPIPPPHPPWGGATHLKMHRKKKMDTSGIWPSRTPFFVSVFFFFSRSHDCGRKANCAWLFTVLISGGVTSRRAH